MKFVRGTEELQDEGTEEATTIYLVKGKVKLAELRTTTHHCSSSKGKVVLAKRKHKLPPVTTQSYICKLC